MMDDNAISDAMSTVLSIAIVVMAGLAISGAVLAVTGSQGKAAAEKLDGVGDAGFEKGLNGFYYTLDPASERSSSDPNKILPDHFVEKRTDNSISLKVAELPEGSPDSYGLTVWTGYVSVPADNDYTFYLSSVGGAWLWVDGKQIIDNHGEHDLQTARSPPVNLKAGMHPVKVKYFYISQATSSCKVTWSAGGPAIDPAYYH